MTLSIKEEVQRLAEMDMAECLGELDEVAFRLKIGKMDLRKAADQRRREIKKEAKAKDNQQAQFEIGSNVEIAKDLVKVLQAQFPRGIVYDEGNFWYYADTDWQKIDPTHMHRVVYRYDGATFRVAGGCGVIRLDTRKIESIVKETSVILYQTDFFANQPIGINCLSGFITFDEDGTPHLLEHSPDHRTRHTIQGRWQPGVKVDLVGSLLAEFLHILFQHFPHCEGYKLLVQEIVGCVLAEYATKLKQPKCFILVGEKANNGKSTLIAFLRGLVQSAVVASISANRFNKQEYVVRLAGKVLNTTDELSHHALESDIFKMLIDGKNAISARDLHKSVVDFKPKALHIFSTQFAPKFHGGIDSGVQRRTNIINFPLSIAKEDMVEAIDEQILASEMDLVLAWGIEGASRIIRNREFSLPPDAQQGIETWIEENDTVRMWASARVRLDPSSSFGYTPFGCFKHYRDWCRLWEHSHPVEKTVFYRRLKDIFPHIELDRTTDTRHSIMGIVLLSDDHGGAAEKIVDEHAGTMWVNNTTTVFTKHRVKLSGLTQYPSDR
jgi:phage/plasmid-associated DNA primase